MDPSLTARDAARRRFAELVTFFDAVRNTPAHRELTAVLAEATHGAPSGPAVEVGCGSGALLEIWSAAGRRAYGLDLVVGMVATARARTGCPGVVADATVLPFADRCLAILAGSLYLQLVPDQEAALAEAFRVLRPGGLHAVLVPGTTWDSDRAKSLAATRGSDPIESEFLRGCAATALATRRYEPRATSAALARAGFEGIQTRTVLDGHLLAIAGRRPGPAS